AVVHDQQVQPAERACRLGDRALRRGRISQIARDRYRPLPPFAAFYSPLGFFRVLSAAAITHRQPAARPGEQHRRRPADAAAPSGDERTLAGEIDHRPAPNAECGMWNAELSCEIARLNDLPLKFHIPHSEFRIVTSSAVLPRSRRSHARSPAAAPGYARAHRPE